MSADPIEFTAQDELRLLHVVMSKIPNLVCYLDHEFRYLYANDAYEAWYGKSRDERINKTVADVVGKEGFLVLKPYLEKALAGKEQKFDEKITLKDGTTRNLRLHYIPDFGPEGQVRGCVVIAEDRTAIRVREDRLNNVIETMSDGLVMQDINSQVIDFNSAALTILDLTEEQLRGKTSLDPAWQAIREDGSPFPGEQHPAVVALRTGKRVSDVLMGLNRVDGTRSWLQVNATPFFPPGREKPEDLQVACTFTDVTAMVSSRNQFEEIFAGSPDLICVCDESGIIRRVNPRFCRLLNYKESELVGQAMVKFVHPDDLGLTNKQLGRLKTGESTVHFENSYRMSDGTYRILSWVAQSDRKNKVFYGMARDITQQKIIEREREGLRAEFEEAQRVARIGNWTWTEGTRTFKWSPQMFDLFDEDILKGAPALERYQKTIDEEDLPVWIEAMRKCMADGEAFKIRVRSVFPDKTLWIEVRGRGIRNSTQEIIGIRGTCQDVTEQVIAEQEINFILEALQIGMWKFNPVTQSLTWDKNNYKVFELEEKDFSGHYQAWESTLTPENKVIAVEELGRALRGEAEFDTTFEIQTKTRGRRFIKGRGKVMRNKAGEPVMMYGINFDRTNEVELEKNYEAERLKAIQNSKLAFLGEMSAGIAHEINNPLAVISGSLALMKRNVNNPEQILGKIEIIARSVDRMAKIINGLRKFARTSGSTAHSPMILADIVKESLLLVEARAKKFNTSVSVDLQSKSRITCDEVGIEQVIVNLMNNGLDATEKSAEKWVKLTVFDDGDQIVMQIHDSGPGVPKDLENRLFQPFFTTKEVGRGTGLGLSIVKGILDEHKATISLRRDSEYTCFEIRFPRVQEVQSAS